jgi:murein DD-endopeptidase MepM/ murein hydrolase activator NlpD
VRSYRYASHAAILLMATAISGYGAVDFGMPAASRAAALSARAAEDGSHVGDVAMGRDNTIIQPVSIPTQPLPNRTPIRYLVKDGDTLDGIAQSFGVTVREITWSNPGLRLPLKTGLALELPPLPGVVVVVKKGDTPESLAAQYGVDETTILGFNHLKPAELTPGAVLVIPVDLSIGPNLPTGLPADPMHPGALQCPIAGAEIIQKFGPTNFALEPPYGGYLHFHSGVDLLADYGTPIDAAAGGRVTAVGYADYFGLRVEVVDSYGLVEIYAHMEDTSVTLGQAVQQGQRVGLVGSTGLSIGSHLHLQLEVGGVPTDPLPLVGC